MTERKTTLIILAWNRWRTTEKCLDTLLETELGNTEIIVVDNGSRDETPEKLQAYQGIRILTLPENLGFVRGNNAALEIADPTSDVVLLNNDMVFTQADWLQRMGEALSDPTVGIVGCRLVLPDGRLLHAGTYILPDTMWGQQIGSNERDLGQYSCRREVQGIVFACALIRREVIAAIGGLSLDYQSYFEDTDYCLRARKAGFSTLLCGDVTLVHDEHGSTRGDDDRLMEIFQRSRATFTSRWRRELDDHYRSSVLFQSIANFSTGYSLSCREMLRALDRRGVRAAYRYVYGPRTVFPKHEPERSDDYRQNVFASRKVPRRPGVSVVYGQGDVFHRNVGKVKIGYTMLEVDGFPKEWVRQANRMDEVWVPSRFNRETFLNSGLEKPVHVVPLGVNPQYFHPGITAYRDPFDEYVFLSVFEWGERKSPWLLLQAFSEEFSAAEPVRLVCKIVNTDPGVSLKHEIRRLGLSPSGGRISYLPNLEFPRYQLGSLYRSCDCFVSPSRGEGWNMPLMEAMACGLPVIATDWGPHQEFLHDGIGYPLEIRGTVPAIAKCPYYSGFSWADPDPEHLRHLLRHVVENRDEARQRGADAAEEMAARWTWDATAAKIMERVAALRGR